MLQEVQTFSVEIDVRFRDLDPLGHVNNAVYFSYLEIARVEVWKQLGFTLSAADWPFVIAQAQYSYKSPLFLGEVAIVSISIGDIRRSSFEYLYEVHEKSTKRLVGTGKTIQVAYNFNEKKVISIPDWLKDSLIQHRHVE